MILGMLVKRDEEYFLVIVINRSYITSPTTDDDGYDTINPMSSKPILLRVPANHSLASGFKLTCIVSTSTINRMNILVIGVYILLNMACNIDIKLYEG